MPRRSIPGAAGEAAAFRFESGAIRLRRRRSAGQTPPGAARRARSRGRLRLLDVLSQETTVRDARDRSGESASLVVNEPVSWLLIRRGWQSVARMEPPSGASRRSRRAEQEHLRRHRRPVPTRAAPLPTGGLVREIVSGQVTLELSVEESERSRPKRSARWRQRSLVRDPAALRLAADAAPANALAPLSPSAEKRTTARRSRPPAAQSDPLLFQRRVGVSAQLQRHLGTTTRNGSSSPTRVSRSSGTAACTVRRIRRHLDPR